MTQGKYAQVTNNPELDGCINALLCEQNMNFQQNGNLTCFLCSGVTLGSTLIYCIVTALYHIIRSRCARGCFYGREIANKKVEQNITLISVLEICVYMNLSIKLRDISTPSC